MGSHGVSISNPLTSHQTTSPSSVQKTSSHETAASPSTSHNATAPGPSTIVNISAEGQALSNGNSGGDSHK